MLLLHNHMCALNQNNNSMERSKHQHSYLLITNMILLKISQRVKHFYALKGELE